MLYIYICMYVIWRNQTYIIYSMKLTYITWQSNIYLDYVYNIYIYICNL